jgi:hypothetical protein
LGCSNQRQQVIREVLDDIEQEIRFRYVKYVSCYIDILIEAFIRTDNSKYIESIPPVHLYLEVGASSKTMISFIGLGLSRTTSSLLTDLSVNKEMNRPEAQKWLKGENWAHSELSPICIREIEKILS